ncbi:toxin-antitoxin system YwqK family antitoxin [Helicobacter didelphidarum]|nr:hypothetical protein [Helicobacter didelphidarum]
MKKIAFIMIFGALSLQSVGYTSGVVVDSIKSSGDSSHSPECKNNEDKIKGCMERVYYSNGNLLREIPYKDGKIEGIKKEYHENGNLLREIPYKDDKRDGVEKRYGEDGSLRFSITFENGKAISGKCGNGKTIDSQKLRELWRLDKSRLGCD